MAGPKYRHDTGVKEVELRRRYGLTLYCFAPCRQLVQQEGIFEDIKILIDGCAFYLRVICYIGKIHNRGVTECSNLQESAERRDIPREPFCYYLLLKICSCVGSKVLFRFI
jgi:hypothetical protein